MDGEARVAQRLRHVKVELVRTLVTKRPGHESQCFSF